VINRRSFLISATAAAGGFIGKSTFAGEVLDTSPEIVVTLPEAHKGTPAIDLDLLNSYGRQPKPIQAFFAEARAVFEADRQARFAENRALQAAAGRHGITHLGGPMLGHVGPDHVAIWLRTV
jgi:hypothetical protein